MAQKKNFKIFYRPFVIPNDAKINDLLQFFIDLVDNCTDLINSLVFVVHFFWHSQIDKSSAGNDDSIEADLDREKAIAVNCNKGFSARRHVQLWNEFLSDRYDLIAGFCN